MKHWTSIILTSFATLALVACAGGAGISTPEGDIGTSDPTDTAGGDGIAPGTDASLPDTSPFLPPDAGTGKDVPAPDPDVVEIADTAPEPDVVVDPVDAADDAAPGDDAGIDPCAAPAPVGCGCTDNLDCQSGYCVPSADGNTCTETCVEECAPGWACTATDLGDTGSTTYLCLPLYTNLCRPCDSGADCEQLGGTGGFCLSMDDGSGSFCGGTCSEDTPCPEGYECQDVLGPAEGDEEPPVLGQNCVPTSGECTCNAQAIKDGASTTCYVGNEFGECAGTRYCDLEGLSDCSTDQPPSEEICDGLDNNCDGLVDEGSPNLDGDDQADCVDEDDDGDGVLDEEDNCPDVAGEQTDTDGDGVGDVCDDDDDGDGVPDVDDCGVLDADYQCTIFYYDEDEDGFGKCSTKQCLCEAEGSYTVDSCELGSETVPSTNDCDDTDDGVYPTATETCDLKDNNCDGVDDNITPDGVMVSGSDPSLYAWPGAACDGPDVDECNAGTWTCKDEGTVECNEEPGASADEVCDGEDNDCDGLTDEADDGTLLEQSCYSGVAGTQDVGLCVGGVAACDGGTYGACAGEVTPQAELCDGLDNDCDGETDEELGETTCGVGQCENTVANCVDGIEQACDGSEGAGPEVCDGIDNDCDGFLDGLDFDMERPACELELGVCGGIAKPVTLCVDGSWAFCGPDDYTNMAALYEAGVEQSCDGVDNDCDGETDEELGQVLCGEGECQKVLPNCVDGVAQVCDDFAEAVDEVCDGLDNDCDGDVDEEQGETTCGVGACEHTVQNCISGEPQSCDAFEGVSDEVCDGIDNDCDGLTDADDPDMALGPCDNQQGVCEGAQQVSSLCVDGEWMPCDAGVYSAHDIGYDEGLESECDGIDSNCSGVADDTFEVVLLNGEVVTGVGQTCGTGECAGGITACAEDISGIVCTTEILASEETCDTLDNNCNGLLDADDPDLVIPPCANQQGVCMGSSMPAVMCVDGTWGECNDDVYAEWSADYDPAGDSCTDAVDNDCNGQANEGCTPEQADITFGSWMTTPLDGLEEGQHAVDLIIGEVGGLGPPVGEPAGDAMYTVEFGFFSTVTP